MSLKALLMKSDRTEYPVADLIQLRKSVRAFDPRPVEQEKINSLFEATRWAPSSTNEQPWLFIYATRDNLELWNKMLETLNEGNKIWAKEAPLLILSLARKRFTRFDSINSHALYDLGGANAFLSLQAVELGLQARQMAGFNKEKVAESLHVPDEYEVGVFTAVGYPGSPDSLPENLKQRELAPRERYLQEVFVRSEGF